MKKTLNRVVSFLLTLTMVFGLCCFPVSAVGTDVNMSFVFTDTDFEVLTGSSKVGDTVFVGIKIDPYKPVKAFGWKFNYDPEVLAFDAEYKNKKQGFSDGLYSAAEYNVVNSETAGTIIVTGAGSKGGAVSADDVADMENGCFLYFKFDVIGKGDAACEFNTEGQGNFQWSMMDEEEKTISVVLPEEPTSLICVQTGVSLSASAAVADGTSDTELTAVAIDADGKDITKSVSWSVTPANSGVTVAADGTVTVGAKAAAGDYTVTATGSANAFGESVAAASAELKVARNASAAVQVVVAPVAAAAARPYYNAQDNTVTLTAVVYDQYGAEMNGTVSWSGDLAVEDGVITVTDATAAGTYTVTATCGNASGSAVITVTEESAAAASLTLDKTADTVTVPAAGTATASYTATVKDQYNRDMDTVIEWTLSGAPAGVTVDANGTVTVPAGIGNCSFTLQAKAGDCTATAAIKTVDLTFANNGAVTVKENPTYGDTWAEIVTIDADKFTAKLGDETLSGGAYTLSVSGTPNVGTYIFSVLYSDSTYTDVVAYSGEVTVVVKTLTVVSDGVSMTKVYDATTDAGELSGDVTFTGKVGEDDVTLEVEKGTYADKNVGGNKIVTLTLSLTGAKKDCYALSASSVEIPASITVSDKVTVAVSAEQNSVVGSGSFTAPVFSGIGGETVDGTLTYTYGGKDMTKEAIETELQKLIKGNTAEIGYKFVASGNYEKTITGTITVTMVDILFKVGGADAAAENAVTVKADPSYGDTWADIVTVSDQIKASVNGVAVEGTYSLSVSGTPDAGTQKYAVLFFASSGDKYQGVTVLESTVTVARKSVAVAWSNTALTYNGSAQKPTATTEVADLVITVDGAETDANIGDTTYTATASTANTNYTLTNDSTSFSIAPLRVAVAWNDTALTYNGAEQKPTATTEVAGLVIAVDGAETDANIGDTTYTATASTANTNYTLTNVSTSFTIAPLPVAVTWGNTALTYNGTAQAPTAAAEGVNGALTLTVDGKTTDAGKGYTATAATADTNYSLTNTACTFDIAAKSIAVTIDAIAAQTFTGEAIEPTVTLRTDNLADGDTLAKDADYTVSCTDNVNAGTASVTVKSVDGSNYTFADASASFTIVPAAAPSLAVQGTTSFKYSVSGAQNVTISGVPANAGTVTYTVGTVTDAQDVIADAVTVSDGVVTFTLNSLPAFVAGVTATIPVTVTMENYATAEVTVAITITDRDVPTVTAENISVTYSGTALTADNIKGTSSVAGTWSWVSDPAAMVNAGSYTATVKFTPSDLVNYTDVDTTIVVTVNQAKVAVPAAAADLVYSGAEQVGVAGGELYTVEGGSATGAGSYTATVALKDTENYAWATAFDGKIAWTIAKAPSAGTPSYTKVNTSGKTLADAVLAIGDITPVGGTIRWVDSEGNTLADDTVIQANIAYKWIYTPADTDNYAELSDSIVLYKRSGSTITLPLVGVLGSGGTDTYAVAIDQTIKNGVVTVSTAKASKGDTVIVTVTPNAGYTVTAVTAATVSNKTIAVQKNADGSYSFTMPAVKVVVSATFSDGAENLFADVYTSDWYHASVYSAYRKGLMKGVSDTLFAPKSNFTRGMMMTALARLAGENTDGGAPWYAKGMAWAMQQGISDGTNPESDITREQAVTMLYRYMQSPKVSENGLVSFTDSAATSDWAVDAMNWAISVGLLQGDVEGTIRPKDTATRAEIAALMVRFAENVQ